MSGVHPQYIPNARQRKLAETYCDTDLPMEECARVAGYSGTRLRQTAAVTLRRLREAGYDIPHRLAASPQPVTSPPTVAETPTQIISRLKKAMEDVHRALMSDDGPDIPACAKRLREEARR